MKTEPNTKVLKNLLSDSLFSLRAAYYRFCKVESLLNNIYTPLEDAVLEIEKRKNDPELKNKISKYLQHDIPVHFQGDEPIFYLSRFLATPNLETLHVYEISQKYPYSLVIGEDTKGLLTPANELKRALAKLPVSKGVSKNNSEIFEYFTIVDFTASQGKAFDTIETTFNESLIEFHNSLFKKAKLHNVIRADETDWVDRNFRGDIFQQYKRMLALLCVHGIMLESYPASEHSFLREIVYPAFIEIEKEFGVRPLMVEHITEEQEEERNWNSYPSEFYEFIKHKFSDNKQQL